MGEWLDRAALIAHSAQNYGEKEPSCQRRLSDSAKPDYRLHPERYDFPRFVIPTADGPVEFHLAVPKEKYDAFAILDLFIRHHGNPSRL